MVSKRYLTKLIVLIKDSIYYNNCKQFSVLLNENVEYVNELKFGHNMDLICFLASYNNLKFLKIASKYVDMNKKYIDKTPLMFSLAHYNEISYSVLQFLHKYIGQQDTNGCTAFMYLMQNKNLSKYVNILPKLIKFFKKEMGFKNISDETALMIFLRSNENIEKFGNSIYIFKMFDESEFCANLITIFIIHNLINCKNIYKTIKYLNDVNKHVLKKGETTPLIALCNNYSSEYDTEEYKFIDYVKLLSGYIGNVDPWNNNALYMYIKNTKNTYKLDKELITLFKPEFYNIDSSLFINILLKGNIMQFDDLKEIFDILIVNNTNRFNDIFNFIEYIDCELQLNYKQAFYLFDCIIKKCKIKKNDIRMENFKKYFVKIICNEYENDINEISKQIIEFDENINKFFFKK